MEFPWDGMHACVYNVAAKSTSTDLAARDLDAQRGGKTIGCVAAAGAAGRVGRDTRGQTQIFRPPRAHIRQVVHVTSEHSKSVFRPSGSLTHGFDPSSAPRT